MRAVILLLVGAALAVAAEPVPVVFKGASALEFTRKAVEFGPRPPGSDANHALQAYIVSQLKGCGCEVMQEPFKSTTPLGFIMMKNIMARFPGKSGKAIAITGHYDTKMMPGRNFVGANDGGSSTGFLLEMARVLAKQPRKDDVYLVWFDGEEAIAEWSDSDSLYGSRHLAAKWASAGMLGRVKALINVDMIGDKSLGIVQEMNSTTFLRALIWQTAADLGYRQHFLDSSGAIEDDHMPFIRAGGKAVDLIDFDYGSSKTNYWHTELDTMDKLSERSFQVVGDVIMEVLRRLEK